MYTNSKLVKAVRLAIAFGAASATAFSANVLAAEEDGESVERIEVTGSMIKRTDLEGALPVTTISKEDIAKTGVTSVPDLVARIPAMQGYTTPSESVGGGGAGQATASLRGIGAEYTLVLLNGKRLAPSGSGAAVDVNAIPIAAIERVEVLTDGASAIYGSDAIAGVINFILKKDIQETTLTARVDSPQESGGFNNSFSLTTGFGDIGEDGFNVFFSYMHEGQDPLASKDRDHSRSGIIPFSYNGNNLIAVADSLNAIPANAWLSFSDGSSFNFNPYQASTGACADNNVPSGDLCRFDFTSTLEIIPEFTRDNFLVGGNLELSDSAELYATASHSIFKQTSRIAPYPTGFFPIETDGSLFSQQIYPHLDQEWKDKVDAGLLTRARGTWRALPGGNRTNEYATGSTFIDLGIRGDYGDISYDFSVNWSRSEREETIITGYPLEEEFINLLQSGDLNVFALPSEITEEEAALLRETMYSGNDSTTETELMSFNGNVSAPVFELPAGDMYVAGGFNYIQTSYSVMRSQTDQRALILFTDPNAQFELDRKNYGIYLETIVPVFEGFEINAAIRYDSIDGVEDTVRQNPEYDWWVQNRPDDPRTADLLLRDENGDVLQEGTVQNVGEDLSDTTYKISASYRPNDSWLFRAATGTGFKAPTMRQIAEPFIPFGVTGNAFDCPFGSSDPLAQYCLPGANQYNVFRQGNANLQPEQSEQFSFGFVYSPDQDFSVQVDYWSVEIEDKVERPTENNIFVDDPAQFYNLYTTRYDPGLEQNVLAIIQAPVNVGEFNTSGVDWGITFGNDLGWATLNTNISGTYIIESDKLRVGTGVTNVDGDFIPAVYDSSLGRKGPDDEVVFRNKLRLVNTLSHGDFVHTLNIAFQSGYMDDFFPGGSAAIRNEDFSVFDGGVQLRVPSHTIVDWLTRYNYDESLTILAGAKNVFDNMPPLALGENGGHQEGFDPRYFDSYGRTFFLQVNYTF
jgi:iron complex outermembrane receptor protein